jgi:hypothetical protein
MTVAAPSPQALVLLPNHAMRARRCLVPVAAIWAWDVALGAAMAWPAAAMVRSAYGTHPRGDAVLWDPGSLPLLDLLVRNLPSSGALIAHAAVVTLFAIVVGLVPAAALLFCLGFATSDKKPPHLRSAMRAGAGAFPPFALLLVITLVFQGSIVAATATAASLAEEGFSPKYGEITADVIALLLLAVGLLAAALAGIVQDAARAAVVRFGVGAGLALRAAFKTVARHPLRLFWSWAWRAFAALVPMAFGALLAGRVGARGGAALVALFVIHQLVVAVRVALRASWLARTMRAVDRGR